MITFNEFYRYCEDKTIVIVGNSRKLIKNPLGEFIDSHEIVLRMNHGVPHERYWRYVGKKTHIWAVAFRDTITQAEIYPLYKPRYVLWLTIDKSHIHPDLLEDMYIADDNFYRGVQEKINGERPSLGCMAVHFFINEIKYKKLDVVGFDFFKSPDYFRSKICKDIHNPDEEEKYITSLCKEKGVEIL